MELTFTNNTDEDKTINVTEMLVTTLDEEFNEDNAYLWFNVLQSVVKVDYGFRALYLPSGFVVETKGEY